MKKKDILLYLSSFIVLAFSFIMFIFAFISVNRIGYYIVSGVTLGLFCVFNRLTEKKIRSKDGYNMLQAYLFYRRCQKNGLDVKVSKIKSEELSLISNLASGYDYCASFGEAQLKELYGCGREVKLLLEEKKGGSLNNVRFNSRTCCSGISDIFHMVRKKF